MTSAKPKRGRPRKYDHVTVTARYKVPVGTFDPKEYGGPIDAVWKLHDDLATAINVGIEINGKRIKKYGGA